ncbi:MAG: sigma-70 family RNA polymerase sigma factor [bacterium]|nr:sigma-70 family RNA polymerase sigma factor [bacterium]
MKRLIKKEIDIEVYYARYGPMVMRRCRSILKDEEKAFDAMQDVFVKLLLYRNRLQGTHPSSLLYRISTNLCLNILRDQHPYQPLESKEILASSSYRDIKENNLDTDILLDYIFKGEKESTHKIAMMYFVDGMTLKEISKEVSLSVSGVHKRLNELRVRVKKKTAEERP